MLKTKLQAEILQYSHEAEFKNQNYRQMYCKIFKRWNFLNKIIGKYIAKYSNGGTLDQNYRQRYWKTLKMWNL